MSAHNLSSLILSTFLVKSVQMKFNFRITIFA